MAMSVAIAQLARTRPEHSVDGDADGLARPALAYGGTRSTRSETSCTRIRPRAVGRQERAAYRSPTARVPHVAVSTGNEPYADSNSVGASEPRMSVGRDADEQHSCVRRRTRHGAVSARADDRAARSGARSRSMMPSACDADLIRLTREPQRLPSGRRRSRTNPQSADVLQCPCSLAPVRRPIPTSRSLDKPSAVWHADRCRRLGRRPASGMRPGRRDATDLARHQTHARFAAGTVRTVTGDCIPGRRCSSGRAALRQPRRSPPRRRRAAGIAAAAAPPRRHSHRRRPLPLPPAPSAAAAPPRHPRRRERRPPPTRRLPLIPPLPGLAPLPPPASGTDVRGVP